MQRTGGLAAETVNRRMFGTTGIAHRRQQNLSMDWIAGGDKASGGGASGAGSGIVTAGARGLKTAGPKPMGDARRLSSYNTTRKQVSGY